MPTHKQLLANRLNARKSSGPFSVEGKDRSRWNALKTGIRAQSEVLPWEDSAEREALQVEYYEFNQPRTPQERSVVDNLIHGDYLSRRFRRLEVKIIVSQLPAGADLQDDAVVGHAYILAGAELGRLQRRMDANHRSFHRDMDELRLLQAERPDLDEPDPDEPAEALAPVLAFPEPAPSVEPADSAPAVVAMGGLHGLLTNLTEGLTEEQIATLTVAQAAALKRAQLSTPQPEQTTTQTEQLASFVQPPPEPPKPWWFNPLNPKHPPIKECHLCNQLGRIVDGCMFQGIPENLRRGRP